MRKLRFSKNFFLIFFIFIIFLFLRIYEMDSKYPFGWDQVDNAWVARSIILDYKFPLVGMIAKQNTGFFIGPIYYYFVAFLYWLTNLNPIASWYIALITSIFTFFTIFFITKKVFSFKVAALALLINSIAFSGFYFDSVQWPVSFIPGISLIFFYFLYKLLRGHEKYIFPLAIVIGLAFHIHFTAVFFPIILLLCVPFFPRNKKMIFYALLSIPLFLIWLIPNFFYQMQNSSQFANLSNYLATYYHGLHLTRVIQLTGDGLIQFDKYLYFELIKPFKILIIPIFLFLFLRENISRGRIIFCYLVLLFFLIPWLVFSTYKGEISDYYFSINRFIALFIISYLFVKVFLIKNLIIKLAVLGFVIYYSYLNIHNILNYRDEGSLKKRLEKVKHAAETNQRIGFQEGVPESYIYYYLMRKKGVIVY